MKKLFVMTFLLTACATNAPKDANAPKSASAGLPFAVDGSTFEEMGAARCPAELGKTAGGADWLKWGAACAHSGKWHQVEAIGNRLSIQSPDLPWGAYFLSLSAEHAKDLPRARWMAELAVKKAPDEGLALYQLARLQWTMDEKPAALENFRKAADKNPSLTEANVLLGELALRADENRDAGRRFKAAYDHDPKHLGVLLGLAEVGMREKNWAETEKYLRAAIQYHPTSLAARLRLAVGQELVAKNAADAIETYRDIEKLGHERKLDAAPSFDVAAKIQILRSNLADEIKRNAARQPTAQEVSK